MNITNSNIIFLLAILIFLSACAYSKPILVKDSGRVTGKVTALDPKASTLTIQSDENIPVTIKINKSAYNFDSNLVGKTVEVQRNRSFSLTLSSPEKGIKSESIKKTPDTENINNQDIKKNGSAEIRAFVEYIDLEESLLLLKLPDGSKVPLSIKENKHKFIKVKKGDQIFVNYSETMAIFVR